MAKRQRTTLMPVNVLRRLPGLNQAVKHRHGSCLVAAAKSDKETSDEGNGF
jgi:hypothetical protein